MKIEDEDEENLGEERHQDVKWSRKSEENHSRMAPSKAWQIKEKIKNESKGRDNDGLKG